MTRNGKGVNDTDTIKYTSDNGYTGILSGRSTFVVLNSDGKEVFHTGFRNINTLEELKEHVDTFPEFYALITGINWEEKEYED